MSGLGGACVVRVNVHGVSALDYLDSMIGPSGRSGKKGGEKADNEI